MDAVDADAGDVKAHVMLAFADFAQGFAWLLRGWVVAVFDAVVGALEAFYTEELLALHEDALPDVELCDVACIVAADACDACELFIGGWACDVSCCRDVVVHVAVGG